MSQPDDIDKLLREVDALMSRPVAGQPVPAAPTPPPAQRGSGRGDVAAWAGANAVGGLVVGGVVGTILAWLPYVSTASTAVGAALGAAVSSVISGPPSWFRRR